MFNLTPQIKLKPPYERYYKIARIFVLFIFLFLGSYLIYKLLFPSQFLTFSFDNPNSQKNTIINPRYVNNKLIFDTTPLGQFSQAEIEFILKKNSPTPTGNIQTRRSFQAFFYETGSEINLNKCKDAIRYSDGQESCVSTIKLVSKANSVYIISEDKLMPIDDISTFEAMSFSWNDVQKADSDELSEFTKTKLFTLAAPHPNGTVFVTKESNKYYLIKNQKKHLITNLGNNINLKKYLKTQPILVEDKSLIENSQCSIERNIFAFRKYKCDLNLENLKNLRGNNYQLATQIGKNVKIEDINVTFKRSLNLTSLKQALSDIKKRLKIHYFGE